jgi:hypothetical protein
MGIDLMRSTKWFSSVGEAKKKVNLENLTFEFDGLKVERTIEGVPVQVYPSEALVFDLGRTKERLYVGYMNDQIPLMLYNKKPPKHQ